MKLTPKLESDGERTNFYCEDDDVDIMPVITVHHDVTPHFKSHRTARMIEKMEDIYRYATTKYFGNPTSPSEDTEFCYDIDYIEHGDKEVNDGK